MYSNFGVADRGRVSGPDCLFSLKPSVYVLKAGLHWCVLKLDVLQCVCPTLSMRTCVCTDMCKLQHVFHRQCCTAYQHMQTGKARATQLYVKQYLQQLFVVMNLDVLSC